MIPDWVTVEKLVAASGEYIYHAVVLTHTLDFQNILHFILYSTASPSWIFLFIPGQQGMTVIDSVDSDKVSHAV